MRDWSDDEEQPDPDYGVFGGGDPLPIRSLSDLEIKNIENHRKKREQERETSAGFNRHMIDLFNKKRS